MKLTTIQNEFLGCMTAVIINNQEEFEKFREFLGTNNLFDAQGKPAAFMTLSDNQHGVAFYRDQLGMYINCDLPMNVEKAYKLCSFNDFFTERTYQEFEQRSLFGNDNSALLKQPDEDLVNKLVDEDPMTEDEILSGKIIETQVKEVKEELSLIESMNHLNVSSIVPAQIKTNIIDCKDMVIDAINKYANIVVTADNFNDLKETRAFLNDKKKILTEQRKRIKDESMKSVNEVYDTMTDIIKAIDHVVNPLSDDIKSFEKKEKENLKNKILNETVKPMLHMLIEKQMLNQQTADQFEFNDSWLKKTSFTAKGNLTKKVQDEMSKEFERLTLIYQNYLKDVETIKSTVQQLMIARNLKDGLKAETYIDLYEAGKSMTEVQTRINQDLETLQRLVSETQEAAQEKQAQINESKQQIQQPEYQEQMTKLIDKEGNIEAYGDSKKVVAKVIETPSKFEGNTYEYTYSFSGSFGTIKTFSNILKLLSMLFKDFKYERK